MNRLFVTAATLAVAGTLIGGCAAVAVTGMTTAALMASDRRTSGTYIEDETIEWKIVSLVRNQFGSEHVNATSFNRRVLLTGEVHTEELRKRVEDAVRRVDNVKEVTNELQVAGVSSMASRGSDSLVTSNVKARMVNNGRFSPNHVKVLTEGGVVYLMGLVTPAEGDAAVEIARTTSGVTRVVKVFEYLPS
jgi:osmotically-inducible protein OsmY